MKNRFFLALFLFLAPAWGLAETIPSPLPKDPLKATIHRLSNGLTVYLSPNHLEPRVSAWIVVRAGSKNDPSDSTGMAHYLEHMLFKGSSAIGTLDYAKEKPHLDRILVLYEQLFKTSVPEERARIYKEIDAENILAARYAIPNEIDKAYKRMGFKGLNAFTDNEQTAYIANFPANRIEAWAKLESERFAHPVFRLFQNEIEIVYEEKNRSEDNPERIIGEALDKQLYKLHPYGQQTTLGSIEHLKNPSLAKMYAFYERNYRPNNMALVLSGDFEREKTLALLEKYFSVWKEKPVPEPPRWDVPAPTGVERLEVKYEAEEKVLMAWLLVSHHHPDEDALQVMDMLMDNSAAGLINLELNQGQKVKSAGSGFSLQNDAGAWYLWAVPKKGQTLEEAEALLMETVAKLKAGQFSDEDIRAIITNYEVSEKSALESNDSRVGFMARAFWELRPWPEAAGTLERLRHVTKADVLRVAKKYLTNNRVVVYRRNAKPSLPSITKPQFTKVAMDPARESAFFKELAAMPVKPLEPKWLSEGADYKISALPSGKLYAAVNPANDLFSLTFKFDLGSRQERFLCAALQLLDLSGAGALSAEEFKKELYRLGTSLNYACGEWESSVHLSGLNENLEPSLKLLFERFAEPSIASDTLKKMIGVTLGAHRDNKSDPDYITHALGEFTRRGRESAVLNELNDKEVLSLEGPALKNLITHLLDYKRRAAYVGNRPTGEIAKLIAAGRGEFKSPPARTPLRYQKPSKTRLLFAHRDMVQSRVGIFAADETFNAENTVDYDFFRTYMGGGMSSVFFQEIREARSLAYAARGGYTPAPRKEDENLVYGELGCQADKTIEAATLMQQLLKSPPFSEKRFRETAKSIEENYRANPLFFRAIPAALMTWEDQGIAGDPRPKRFQKSLDYKLSDLKVFSGRFTERTMSFFILGNKSRLDFPALKNLGNLEEKTLEEIFPY